MKDYTVWVSYHKKEMVEQYNLREDEHHKLFYTNSIPKENNINIMNPVYSEMVTMWYVWKNNIKSEYVGFEHYRRHLDIQKLPKSGQCQVFMVADFVNQTIYEQYATYHCSKDMDLIIDILNEKYGEGNKYVDHIMNSKIFIANCTFFMKWEDFTKLCEFMFGISDEFCRRVGITGNDEDALIKWKVKENLDFNGRNVVYQTRILSFLMERLISAWIYTNMDYYRYKPKKVE